MVVNRFLAAFFKNFFNIVVSLAIETNITVKDACLFLVLLWKVIHFLVNPYYQVLMCMIVGGISALNKKEHFTIAL